jgi:hypothetical protein
MIFFSKFKKKMMFKLISKICRTTFFKTTSQCIRKCKKRFIENLKVENFDKNNQKSPIKHFRLGMAAQNPQ